MNPGEQTQNYESTHTREQALRVFSKEHEVLERLETLTVEGYPIFRLSDIGLAQDTAEVLGVKEPATFDFLDLMTDETVASMRQREQEGIVVLEEMIEAIVKKQPGLNNPHVSAQYIKFSGEIIPSVFPNNERSVDSKANLEKFRHSVNNSNKPFAILHGHGTKYATGINMEAPKGERVKYEMGFGENEGVNEGVLVREVIDAIGLDAEGNEKYSAILLYACNPGELELSGINLNDTAIFYVDRDTGPFQQAVIKPASKSINT